MLNLLIIIMTWVPGSFFFHFFNRTFWRGGKKAWNVNQTAGSTLSSMVFNGSTNLLMTFLINTPTIGKQQLLNASHIIDWWITMKHNVFRAEMKMQQIAFWLKKINNDRNWNSVYWTHLFVIWENFNSFTCSLADNNNN